MAIDKAIDSAKEAACRTAEANAIREKLGSSAPISYDFEGGQGFAAAIEQIPQGGSATEPYVEETLESVGRGLIAAHLHGYDFVRDYAFTGCRTLISVEGIDDVTGIGTQAFDGCFYLPMDALPENLARISGYAFRDCYMLAIDEIPASVGFIDTEAFANCLSLTSITFLTEDFDTTHGFYIAEDAFSGCSSLTDIYVPWADGDVPGAPWGAENATVHYAGTPALTFVPILPDDTTAFPMYLKGYRKFKFAAVTGSSTALYALAPFDAKFGDSAYCNVYPTCATNLSYSNMPNPSVRCGSDSSSTVYKDRFYIKDTAAAATAEAWNTYLATHSVEVLAELDTSDDSLWFAVKASNDTYGYYCPATEDYCAAYGMSGTVIERVEYVEGNNDAYCTTDYHLRGDDTLKIKFQVGSDASNIGGCFNNSSAGDNFCLYAGAGAKWYMRYDGGNNRNYTPTTDWQELVATPTGATVNDNQAETWQSASFTSRNPMYIGYLYASSSPKIRGKLAYFEVANKHKYLPVKVGSTYRMFDVLAWELATQVNAWTGGAVIAEAIEFPEEITEDPVLLTMGGSPNPQPEPGEED